MATRSTTHRTRRTVARPVPVRSRPRFRWLRRLVTMALVLVVVLGLVWAYLLHVYAPGLREEARSIPALVHEGLAQHGAVYTPKESLSPNLRHAIVAIEDRRFYLHPGIDPVSLVRAAWMRFTAPNVDPGGSTLELQLAKRTIVHDDSTFHERLRILGLAWAVDQDFSKPYVLEMYLNAAYYGRGAYGAESAAQTYFGTDAAHLTVAQAALLAALVQAPSIYSVHLTGRTITHRWRAVIQNMSNLGYISPAQAQAAESSPLVFAFPPS